MRFGNVKWWFKSVYSQYKYLNMGALISTQFYKKSVLSAVYNLTYKFQFITFFGFDKNFVNYFEASLERMSIFWKMQFESIFFYSELESKFPYIIQIIFEVWFLFWDWAKFLNNYFLTKKYTWFIFGLRFFFSKMHIKIWKQFASRVLIPFNFFFSFLNVLFVKKFSFTFDFWNIFLLKQKEFSEIRNGKKKFLFFFFFMVKKKKNGGWGGGGGGKQHSYFWVQKSEKYIVIWLKYHEEYETSFTVSMYMYSL